ncbi:MAG: LysR family transcriptional regulator [Rhodospirillales bacterium]|nr:LysR family transcriptional regulator [Rhodospirillales bacterium]
MNLRQLEIFRAIMQTGTTLAAADLLLISQPAVSNVLRQFETQLGFKLFHRVGGRLRPTREAHSLYEGSEEVFSSFDSVQHLAEDLRRGWTGTLQVVVSPSLGHTIVPPAVKEFLDARPQVRINLDTPSNERIVEMLAGGRADLALTITPIEHPAIRSTVLREGAIYCAMPPGHPLAKRRNIEPADFSGENLISYPRESALGLIIDNVFRDVGQFQEPSVEVRYALTALALVESGVGLAMIDEFTLTHARTHRIVKRPVLTKRTVPMVLSRSRNEPLSTLGSAFVETCIRQAPDEGPQL